ncbi:MAG: carboxypeptidase-like regulatory domain-containing protein [bacterium]
MNKYTECEAECSKILTQYETGIMESGNYLFLSDIYEIKADCLDQIGNIEGSVLQLQKIVDLLADKLPQDHLARIKLKIGQLYKHSNLYSRALSAFKRVEREYADIFPDRFAKYARENAQEINSKQVALISGQIRKENGTFLVGATIKVFNGFGESETISGTDGKYDVPLYFSSPLTHFSLFAYMKGYKPAVINRAFNGSVEIRMDEILLKEYPNKTVGALAGVIYTPIRGGKRVQYGGIKEYRSQRIEFQKIVDPSMDAKSNDTIALSSDAEGAYMAFLPSGSYRLNESGRNREFFIEKGELKIINIQVGNVKVD